MVSAGAVLVVADTLRTHRDLGWRDHDDPRFPSRCPHPCAQQFKTDEAHAAHVAAAVVDALGGLEREWGSQMLGDDEITIGSEGTARFCAQQHPLTWTALSRWVSGWVREPAEEDQP